MDNNLKSYKKIAIMGGTFDPIHNGHLIMAEFVRDFFEIEKTLFIPANISMHKKTGQVSEAKHRLLMTKLAIETNENFEISEIELKRAGSTYTVDTLEEIRNLVDLNCKLFFIVGADSFLHVHEWRNISKIFKLCEFVVVFRAGFDKKSLKDQIKKIKNICKATINIVEIPLIEISSTQIRLRVKENKTIKYLVPNSVRDYIIKNKLYFNYTTYEKLTDTAKELLEKKISSKRMLHSISTANEAVKLANFYGENSEKAYFTGLVHDIAKEISAKKAAKLCVDLEITLDETTKKSHSLTHAPLGAEIVKKELGVSDVDILNAIKYHTTARENMSLLEKIIYLADKIEPSRNYEEVENLRKLAYTNINLALLETLESITKFSVQNGVEVHNLSYKAIEFLKNEHNFEI